jgi:hypothetical protein
MIGTCWCNAVCVHQQAKPLMVHAQSDEEEAVRVGPM